MTENASSIKHGNNNKAMGILHMPLPSLRWHGFSLFPKRMRYKVDPIDHDITILHSVGLTGSRL